MSYRIQKRENLPWFPQKTLSAIRRRIKVQGYHVPFSERRVALFGGDGLLLLLAACGAFIFWEQADSGELMLITERMRSAWFWFPALLGGWWTLAWLNDLYDIPSSYDYSLLLIRLAIVNALALLIYLFVYFGAPTDALPRIFFLHFLIFSSVLIALWRFGYIRLSKMLPFPHRVLIVGTGEQARTIAEALQLAPGLRYEIVGYLDEPQPSRGKKFPPVSSAPCEPVLGSLQVLPFYVQSANVHEVIIALENTPDRALVDLVVDCQANGIYVSWMPTLYEKLLRRIPVQHFDPTWALQATVGQPSLNRLQLGMKRLLDLLLIALALPSVTLVLPLVALAIWIDSGGPIFYRQQRCGRAGKPFTIYKFRTMQTNAEADGQPQWAQLNDSRITRVGRFLRRTRLDELPQLLNILRGDMSIVGPRPERPEFVEKHQQEIPYYRTRFMVSPGLTGWAQIHYPYGNTDEDAEVKLQYDFYYIRYWSIWLDLYTMFRTISVVLRFQGV